MGNKGKSSAFGTKPVQAEGRIRAKPTGSRVPAKLAEGGIRLGKEVAANFRAWFERNFVNRRAGRIGHMSYSRAGMFDDRPGDGLWYAEALDRAWTDYRSPLTASEMGYITDHPLIAFQLAAGITDARGVRCMIRGLTLRTNSLQRKAYRSRYYGQENARRRMLAAERRKITRRTTTNPCPTPEAFRAAFARVGESVEAKLLFGGMVHDLACYVDSCLRYDAAGNIVGRNGGIKAWLSDNAPELHPRYKTIMRYKALAMRLRQAMGVKDPEPTSALFGGSGGNGTAPGANNIGSAAAGHAETQLPSGKGGKEGGGENYSALKSHHVGVGEGNDDGDGNNCGGNDGGGGCCDGSHGNENHGGRDNGNRDNGNRDDGGRDNGGRDDGNRDDGRRCRGRLGLEYMRRRCSRRKEQLRKLLGGCGNTFKAVLARIDAELDRMTVSAS